MRTIAKKSTMTVLGLATFAAFVTSPMLAQETLRWKLEVGDKLQYDTKQDMSMSITGTPLGEITLKTNQQMDMTWEVLETNEEGDAVIRQKVERVRVSMAGPMGQGVDYDSDATEPPAAGAAVFEAMKKGDFQFTLTPRGELKDVQVSDEVLRAFKNSPQAAQMGDQITAEGIQKILMQDVIVLPEKALSDGDTWTAKSEVTIPSVGKQTLDTTYKFESTKEVEGKNHAVITADRKVSFAQADNVALQMEIKEQSSEGESLFNIEDGRLGSMNLKHHLTMNATAAGQTIVQELDQTSEVEVKPAEAANQESKDESQEPAEEN